MLALYVEWHGILTHRVPKLLRYSLGARIDELFAEILEAIALAQFSSYQDKGIHLERAIAKNDTLKFMLYVLYELKGIDEKRCMSLAAKAEEVGRMLYGWKKSAETKKNLTK